MDPLKFKAEIEGNALKTLTEIEKKLNSITDKKIKLNIDGLGELKEFLKSDSFGQMAENINKAFGKNRTKNVFRFFEVLKSEIEGIKKSIQEDNFGKFIEDVDKAAKSLDALNSAYQDFVKNTGNSSSSAYSFIANMGKGVAEVEKSITTAKEAETKKSKEVLRQSIEDAKYQIRKIDDLYSKGFKAWNDGGKQDDEMRKRLDTLQRIRTELEKIAQTGTLNGLTTSKYVRTADFRNSMFDVKDSIQKNKELSKTNDLTRQLTDNEERLAQAIQKTNTQGRNQVNVLGEMKSMMAQYVSVYGVSRFLTEMTQITGELELQKRSLEVIIDSSTKAAELYSNIRDLSQESPYTFQDLLKSERQLAAFGIQTKDLFSTMRALSDIGAGLSVDVQRLILAYGHTRSYGYLSGIQNRQFETAGIDLMGELVKYYNKQAADARAQGRIAKSVSRMDMFTRMRKRDIPFEDVEKVILALDQPGGRFYNMQERQYNTLGGKLRNLKNNYNIMMSEMGESNKNMLTGFVNMLNKLTGNWQKYVKMLKTVLYPLGAVKLAMMAINKTGVNQSAMLTRNIMEQAKLSRVQQGMMAWYQPTSYGVPVKSGAEAFGVGLKNAWGTFTPTQADMKSFRYALMTQLTSGKVSQDQLISMSLDKNLPTDYRRIAGEVGGLSKQYANFNAQLKGGKLLAEKFKLGMVSLGSGIGRVARSMVSFLTGPQAIFMAILGTVTALWQQIKKGNEETKRFAQNIREAKTNDAQSVVNILDTYGAGYVTRQKTDTKYNDGKKIDLFDLSIDESIRTSNLTASIMDMKEKLQALSPFYDGDLLNIESLELQYEQFEALINRLESLRHAKEVESAYGNAIANTSKNTRDRFLGIPYGDTFIQNLTDFDEAVQAGWSSLDEVTEEELDKINKALKGKLEDIQKTMQYNDLREALGKYLFDNRQALSDYAYDGAGNPTYDLLVAPFMRFNSASQGKSFLADIKEVEQDFDKMGSTIADIVKTNFENDPQGAKDAIRDLIQSLITTAGVTTAEGSQFIISQMMQSVREQLPETFKALVDEMQREQILTRFMNSFDNFNFENATPEEKQQAFNQRLDDITRWAQVMGYDFSQLGLEAGQQFWEGFYKAQRAAENMQQGYNEWQKQVRGVIISNNALRTAIGKEPDILEGVDLIQKDLKENYENLENSGKIAAKALKDNFNIDYSPDKIAKETAKDNKALEKVLDARLKMLQTAKKKAEDEMNAEGTSAKRKDVLNNILTSYINPDEEATIKALEDVRALILLGVGTGLETNSGHEGQSIEKRWDERIRIMKEAYDWYDKWEKKIGNTEALDKVNERYKDIFDEWRTDKEIPLDFDVKKIADYEKYVEKIRDEALELYEKQKNDASNNNGQEALRVYRQAVAMLTDINYDKFTRAAEDFSSIIEKTMDDLQYRWELFSSILADTHDLGLSYDMARIIGDERNYTNMADALRAATEDIIAEAGFENIEFDMSIDTKSLRHMLETSLPAGANPDDYSYKIDGVVKAYQDWQKAQRDLMKNDAQLYGRLMGSSQSYEKQIHDINEELRQQIQALMRLRAQGVIKSDSDLMAAIGMAAGNADSKKLKLSGGYANLFNNAMAMTQQSFDAVVEQFKADLDKKQREGRISPDEYVNEMKRLDSARLSRLSGARSAFGALIGGGQNGLADFYGARLNEARTRLSRLKEGDAGFAQAQADVENLQQLYDEASETGVAMDKLQSSIKALQGSMSVLSDMFEALGDEDTAHLLSSSGGIGSTLSGVASGSQYGPWGAVLGGAIGFITGVARENDYFRQKQIDENNRMINVLRDIDSRLSTQKQRAMGYASADDKTVNIFRQTVDEYRKAQEFLTNPSGAADAAAANERTKALRVTGRYSKETIDAMEAAASSGTAYAAEYASLLAERDKYQANIQSESRKSNSDSNDIEEWNKQIDELNDKIAYMAEDISKELWGIDIKGWADQINDALMNAFENGEDAAKAYEDTVRSIMQNVASDMLKMSVLEPMMEQLREKLFGKKGDDGKWSGGVVSTDDIINNPKEAAKKVATAANDFFNVQGAAMITAGREFYEGLNAGLNGILTNPNQKTLSASIQGTAEQTSDLLAGYVATLMQDVGANRLMLQQFISSWATSFTEERMQNLVGHIGNIDSNVKLILQAISVNGELYEQIASMRTKMDNITNGIEYVHIQ